MTDSLRRDAIAFLQDTITELVASPAWPDGSCRVALAKSRTSILIIGKGRTDAIVGIPGLHLKQHLERAGFEVYPGPLLADGGGWLVVASIPDVVPDAETLAVVRGVVRQVGFELLKEACP